MGEPTFSVRAFLRCAAAGFALALALCEGAAATGFFINQQSVTGLGRVDAGNTAAADDIATIFFNPAGLVHVWQNSNDGLKGARVSIGAHLIIPRNDQNNTGSVAATPGSLGTFVPVGGGNGHNPTDPSPAPNFYWALPLMGGNAAIGVGLNFPFGLATQFDSGWHGRYDAIEASLRTYNLSVVGSYKIDYNWSIGGGIDVQYARATLTQAIPNPFAPGGPTAATDAQSQTNGHDYTPGFNIGVLYRFNDDDRVGLHYRSGMKHDLKGTTGFLGLPGPLAGLNGVVDIRANLDLPAIATAGFRKKLNDSWVLLGEIEWYDWSTFREIRTQFNDGGLRGDGVRQTRYRDTWAVAVGAEYKASDAWLLRGGVQFDQTPTTDAWRDTTVPDSDRLWLGLGATYQPPNNRNVRWDFAFNHVFFRDTNIALTRTFFDGTPLASSARINSDVKTVTNTISVNFRYGF